MSLISIGRKNLKLFKHAETCLSFSSEGVVPPCLKRGKHSTSVCIYVCDGVWVGGLVYKYMDLCGCMRTCVCTDTSGMYACTLRHVCFCADISEMKKRMCLYASKYIWLFLCAGEQAIAINNTCCGCVYVCVRTRVCSCVHPSHLYVLPRPLRMPELTHSLSVEHRMYACPGISP